MRHPRMTTRRWMIVTTVVAVSLWGGLRAQALQQRAAFHAREKQACFQEAQSVEKRHQWLEEEGHNRCGPRSALIEIQENFEAAPELRERAEYHADLEATYRRVARYPWISVSAEKPFIPDDRGHSPEWLRAKAKAYESLEVGRRGLAAKAEALGQSDPTERQIRWAVRDAQLASSYHRRAAFRTEEPRPSPPSPTPVTAVARAASMPPAPRRSPRAVDRPLPAITRAAVASRKSAEDARGQAVARLVEQLRKHPARPSATAAQVGLYLIDAGGREITLIANEPAPRQDQCGSPSWSHDGRRIVFDATPGIVVGKADFTGSHLWSLELDGSRLATKDLGPGNCPDFSPADDRIVFLLNSGGVPGAQVGVWLMQSDGSGRRSLGDYGRPKWSPESRQFLIASFSTPTQVTIMDVRPESSGVLKLPDHQLFSVPSWAGEGTLVAVIGAGSGDTIALIDVTDPAQGKVKEVLWKRDKGLDVQPFNPVYSPVTRQCVFVGKVEGKGRALYSFHHGKPDRPARLEPGEQFDNLIQDPAFSPDGRYIVFSSDRKANPAPPPAAAPGP